MVRVGMILALVMMVFGVISTMVGVDGHVVNRYYIVALLFLNIAQVGALL